MSYLVDSDWVADYLKGRVAAVNLLDRLYADNLSISIITYSEIYEGIYYGSDPRRNEAVFLQFLGGVRVLGITRPIARRFAEIRGALRARGELIPHPDLLIAATAIHYGLTLITRNVRHFDRIPGLAVYQET